MYLAKNVYYYHLELTLALEVMIIRNNLGKTTVSSAEWLQCFFELMSLDKLKTLKEEKIHLRDKRTLCKHTKQVIKKSIYRTLWRKHTIEGNDKVREYVFRLGTTFCGYIKHGERAKMERRVIASPNIIKRMFLKIIEDFHLALGKDIDGSTISIGGDEKKKKILINLDCRRGDRDSARVASNPGHNEIQ